MLSMKKVDMGASTPQLLYEFLQSLVVKICLIKHNRSFTWSIEMHSNVLFMFAWRLL